MIWIEVARVVGMKKWFTVWVDHLIREKTRSIGWNRSFDLKRGGSCDKNEEMTYFLRWSFDQRENKAERFNRIIRFEKKWLLFWAWRNHSLPRLSFYQGENKVERLKQIIWFERGGFCDKNEEMIYFLSWPFNQMKNKVDRLKQIIWFEMRWLVW